VDLRPHEVLARVLVPFTARHEYVAEFKQAHRRDDDIAIVNAGMRVRMARGDAGASWAFRVSGLWRRGIVAPSISGVAWADARALFGGC
jgi:xanthine dehydrogenase/oxidase